MNRDAVPAEIPRLMAKLVENALQQEEISALRNFLASGEAAQRYYYCYLDLHEELETRYYRMPADHHRGHANEFVEAKPTLFSRLLHSTLNSSWAAVCLIAVLFYGGFALIAWNLRPEAGSEIGREVVHSQASPSDAVVAKLTSEKDCVWQAERGQRIPHVGQQLRAGAAFRLRSGVAEVTFADGAVVTLEGPTRFVAQAAGSGLLKAGRLFARVPRRAIGFAIDTAAVTIVDLGTEFGVEVQDNRATEVQVFAGKVELKPAREGPNTFEQVVLPAGTARTVTAAADGNTFSVRESAWQPERFVRHIGAKRGTRMPVYAAIASSEFGQFSVNNLINGNGLVGDAHSSLLRLPSGVHTMWSSGVDRTKNEYVLFDLGKPRRVDRVKIWNYNDFNTHGARGAAQIDICVANSTKGDPVSTPDFWKRVVVDHQLQPASGKESYDTPDVISLDSVVARYIGIVIDDWFPPDTNATVGFHRCVGLSEVQFFGEREEIGNRKN